MPRQEHVLSVFVASPSDVSDEREKLEEVIRDLNITWSRELGIRLDLIRWETHAYPGMGIDAQDVINAQIADDYDLFIGIMWCRFGTATGRAGSGTQEEFQRAKDRFDREPNSINIMMYFKDEAIPPSQLDVEQLASVNEFRNSLGSEGILYWRFNELNDFETYIRLHLSRQVQNWRQKIQSPDVISEPAIQIDNSIEDDLESDLGILDFAEIFEERFAEVVDLTTRITKSTENLGIRINQRTAELKELPRDTQGNTNRNSTKRSLARAATDMNQYAEQMSMIVPVFSEALNAGMNAFLEYIRLSSDSKPSNSEAQSALDGIIELIKAMETSERSMSNFRERVFVLPRMTKELNKAKRAVVSILDKFIEELTTGQTILKEAKTTLNDFVEANK
ncbi:MAG: DUF4062 domain-containing protein, partial [Deinococcota bacterium]